jgi:hypothetical protein
MKKPFLQKNVPDSIALHPGYTCCEHRSPDGAQRNPGIIF